MIPEFSAVYLISADAVRNYLNALHVPYQSQVTSFGVHFEVKFSFWGFGGSKIDFGLDFWRSFFEVFFRSFFASVLLPFWRRFGSRKCSEIVPKWGLGAMVISRWRNLKNRRQYGTFAGFSLSWEAAFWLEIELGSGLESDVKIDSVLYRFWSRFGVPCGVPGEPGKIQKRMLARLGSKKNEILIFLRGSWGSLFGRFFSISARGRFLLDF